MLGRRQLAELLAYLNTRFTKMEKLIMATQADIDAITTELGGLTTQLAADDAAIQEALATLAAQGVDVTALQAAASSLSDTVAATTALVPAPVTPPAPPSA